MHDDHDIAHQVGDLISRSFLEHLEFAHPPTVQYIMLFNMLIRYFMLSVLAERVVSFVLPHQEILTSSPAEKDPNAILKA